MNAPRHALVALLLVTACTGGRTTTPSTRDAGQRPADATAPTDTGPTTDATTPDAGAPEDATTHPDATSPGDAETTPDAAAPDAEPTPDDAATPDTGTPPVDGGPTPTDSGPTPTDAGGPVQYEVTFRVHLPNTTPSPAAIHIAGNFQAWDPGSATHALAQTEPFVHEITLTFNPNENLEFKFTRGSWPTVEKGPNGEEIANRTHQVTASTTLHLSVENWADFPHQPHTRTGDIHIFTVPGFLSGRPVRMYLPPNYHQTTDHYPVLYMLDGQNIFDANTSFSGEWQVDETLQTLIPANQVHPLIVVAIDNGGGARLDEYTPWMDTGMGTGGGAPAHLTAIIDILKPYIDTNYRTLTGPDDTGISGSSLGGLFTLYTTYARPDVFRKNAALSPSIWWDDEEILNYAAMSSKPPSKVWMDMGTAESASAITNLRAMRDLMVMQGFLLGVDLQVVEEMGAGHNEAAWAGRFPDVVQFIFPP